MTALLKTTQIQEPSSSTVNLTLDTSGGVTVGQNLSVPAVVPTGSTAPTNGMYLPAANTVGITTNSTERMRIDGSGNVGIGKTSPSYPLDVGGSGVVRINPTTGTNQATLLAANTGGNFYFAKNDSAGSSYSTDAYASVLWSSGAYPIVTATNGTERMRIDSSGNVGIGTTNPAYKLNIYDATDCYTWLQGDGGTGVGVQRASTDTTSGYLGFHKSRGTQASKTAAATNDQVGDIFFNAYGGSNYRQIALIRANVETYTSDTNISGYLRFYTNPGGITLSERMRINSDGYVLIGYTASNGAYRLQVNSQIFATNATIATSDGRYKEDVADVTNALSLVSLLKPVTFKWKQHPVHDFPAGETDIGFIAQDVKEALKDTNFADQLVKSNTCKMPDDTEEEFLGIAEGKLVPLLVKAIQELTAKVEALEAKVGA